MDGVETSEELHFFYDAQSRPAFVEYGGIKYHYLHNLQGDIVAIVDSIGNPVVEYKYDAWGRVISIVCDIPEGMNVLNPFGYRGYVYDIETGLYYQETRFYDSGKCRFIIADAWAYSQENILACNPFLYCFNCPVKYCDDNGEWPTFASVFRKVAQAALVVAGVAMVVAAPAVALVGVSTFVGSALTVSGVAIATAAVATIAVAVEETISISYSKGHQGNMRDTGLSGLGNEEIERRLKDPNTSSQEKRRLQREQKARGQRNKKKREEYHHKVTLMEKRMGHM